MKIVAVRLQISWGMRGLNGIIRVGTAEGRVDSLQFWSQASWAEGITCNTPISDCKRGYPSPYLGEAGRG